MRKKEMLTEARSIILLILVLFIGLCWSGEISEYVSDGMELAIKSVIPSSFTFMIISDIYISYGYPENIRVLKALFTRLLGFSPTALSAFVCGNIGGFPIGAKMVSDCYICGSIGKEDAERLIPLSSNPSCAFMIGGVGLGIYGDVRLGIILALSVYSATLILGIVTRSTHIKNKIPADNIKQNYNFIESVKRSGMSSISLISFITLFSVINGIVKKHVKITAFSLLISVFLEVTNAVKTLSLSSWLSPFFTLSLSAFALGFGGLSVAMQSSVFTSAVGLRMKKYYIFKLLEGILSASVFSLLYYIKNNCGAA